MNTKILDIIYAAIEELNDSRGEDEPIAKQPDTLLYGQASPIDSVDLVNLLISVEEALEDEFDISFVIANEKAMSMKNSPFKSVTALCDYLSEELKDQLQ